MNIVNLPRRFKARSVAGMSALLSLSLLSGQVAFAGTITFNDLGPGVPFVTDTTGGRAFGGCTALEVCTVTLVPAGVLFSSPGSTEINIWDDPAMTQISDTFVMNVSSSGATLTFWSSDTQPPLIGRGVENLVETGALQNLAAITWLGPGAATVDTISFQSRDSSTPNTPETGTFVLGGFALLVLGWRRRAFPPILGQGKGDSVGKQEHHKGE